MERCRAGDPDAWKAFLAPFQEIGRRAIRPFRLSEPDSEDILSDVLTSLYAGGLSRFRGRTIGEFVAFVKAVSRNRTIDFVKGKRKLVSNDPSSEGQMRQSTDAVNTLEPSDISNGIADEECLEFLRQEIHNLRREDRELYLMKARGLKEREIVEQTRKPPGTVSSQIARLLERLRERLKERGCL